MSNIPRHRHQVISASGKGEGLTEQSHARECEIHEILRQYKKTGILKHVNQFKGSYLDMASAPDFQEAMNVVAEAKSMFATVPSHIRDQFENDPEQFLEFVQDEDNRDEMEEMGLDISHFPPRNEAPTPETPPEEEAQADLLGETE